MHFHGWPAPPLSGKTHFSCICSLLLEVANQKSEFSVDRSTKYDEFLSIFIAPNAPESRWCYSLSDNFIKNHSRTEGKNDISH